MPSCECAASWLTGHCSLPTVPHGTAEAFDELDACFVQSPDLSEKKFLEKLDGQMRDASEEAKLLMAELLFLNLVVVSRTSVGQKKKIEIIETALSWMDDPPVVPASVVESLAEGVLNPGTFYMTRRDVCLTFLIHVGQAWKALSHDEQTAVITDPWQWKGWLYRLDAGSAITQREALIHLDAPRCLRRVCPGRAQEAHRQAVGGARHRRARATSISRSLRSEPPSPASSGAPTSTGTPPA